MPVSQYELLGQTTHDLAILRNEYRTLLDLLRRVCDGSIDRSRVVTSMEGAGSWTLLAEQPKQGPAANTDWFTRHPGLPLSEGPLTPADVEPRVASANLENGEPAMG